MTPFERIKAMVEGKPVDRIGLAAWYHMPLLDHVPKDFARGIINSCRIMKWDLCKIQYHALYFENMFGLSYQPSTSASLLVGPVTRFPVSHPALFRQLQIPGIRSGSLGRELELTKRVLDELQGVLPVLPTIFSPLYTARGLCGGSAHPEYIKSAIQYSPEDVHAGLKIITGITLRFIDELLKLGIDGIFLADAFASTDDMDEKTHKEFGAAYDLQILNYIKDKTWFNMLHVHGYKNLRFTEYEALDYPVQAYNWEDRFGDAGYPPISLKTVRALTDKVLMGGIDFWNDFNSETNDREAVKAVLKARLVDALGQLGPSDSKFIFSPGCSVKMHVPEYRMQLMHEVVEEVTGVA
jgi:uroporphyrinogen decarboxylase